MSENVLKKEFKEKDVQRLRNLVQGKYGEKATMGTGYTKKQEFHEEGDVWEEDGFDPDATDGDGDGFLQDGTIHQRPVEEK